MVLPPDSEVVANFSIDGGQLGTCALIDPNWDLTEDFGVIVGHTLVDATTPSASVLIINPNTEEVVVHILEIWCLCWLCRWPGRIHKCQ